MNVLEFEADGRPRTQGSHLAQRDRRTGRVRVAPVQEDDLKQWRRTIRDAASRAASDGRRAGTWPREIPEGPMLVVARFRLTLPRRLAGELDPEPAIVVPDGDKLERALWDALTGLAFADDRQVIAWAGTKRYANPMEVPGVSARVAELDGPEAARAEAYLVSELGRGATW